MTVWYRARTMSWPAKAVIAVGLLAVLLVAAVPVALLAGFVMMLLGHVAGGLALFGASVLAATAAVVIAGMSGVRYLRGAGQPGGLPARAASPPGRVLRQLILVNRTGPEEGVLPWLSSSSCC